MHSVSKRSPEMSNEAPNAAYRLALEKIIASSTDEARKADLRKLAEKGITVD